MVNNNVEEGFKQKSSEKYEIKNEHLNIKPNIELDEELDYKNVVEEETRLDSFEIADSGSLGF